jgi:TfoX/Sxy family transcriptional regulator of competence genes
MAYDEGLAERIRSVIDGRSNVTEKEMFGGVAFMLGGKMFVGIVKDDLLVRVGPERYAESLKRRHVRPMDFTGKPMTGYIFVGSAALDADAELEHWIRLGAQFVATLPSKKPRVPTVKPARRTKSKRAPQRKSR